MKGWVYIITNKSMPDLIKVGFTTKDPDLRASELDNTGTPHPYVVEYEVLVENPKKNEQLSHANLKKYKENKEWFRCSLEQGILGIREVLGDNVIYENNKYVENKRIEKHLKKIEQEKKRKREIEEQENARRKEEDSIRDRNKIDTDTQDALGRFFIGPYASCLALLILLFGNGSGASFFWASVCLGINMWYINNEKEEARKQRKELGLPSYHSINANIEETTSTLRSIFRAIFMYFIFPLIVIAVVIGMAANKQ